MDLKKLQIARGLQLVATYIIKAVLVAAVLISAYNQDWEALLSSFLALALTFTPALLERNYKINLPIELELVVILFAFSSVFLGEVQGFYTKIWWWDIVLHTSAGVISGFIGFLVLYILYYQKKIVAPPGLTAFFAFCFALALGSIWEIFEYSMDAIFSLNMQKSGLVDTMWDLIVNASGALIISILGYFYIKSRTHGSLSRMIRKLFPKPKL